MSLVALASRIIFTQIVRGRTFAEDRVRNAPLEPIEEVTRESKCVIAVYTGVQKNKPRGRAALSAGSSAATMEIVFQCYIPPAETDGPLGVLSLQKSGAGIAVDLMQRQVLSALQTGSDEWYELWCELVMGYADFDSKPILVVIEDGIRIPAREVTLLLEVINEPTAGAPIPPFWTKLDGMIRQVGEIEVADLIMCELKGEGLLPSWRQAMATLGLSRRAVDAGGLGPVDHTLTSGEPAVLTAAGTYPATIETVAIPGESYPVDEDNP